MAIVALSAFFSMNAFANNNVVYSCTTTDNQTLKVTKEGETMCTLTVIPHSKIL